MFDVAFVQPKSSIQPFEGMLPLMSKYSGYTQSMMV